MSDKERSSSEPSPRRKEPSGAEGKAQKRKLLSPKARRRLKRTLIGLTIALPIAIGAMWYAANTVPWFGAWMADTLRSIIGTEGVADLEEFAYDMEDRFNRFSREGEKPKAYWDSKTSEPPPPTPSDTSSGAAPSTSAQGVSKEPAPVFRPKDPGPYNAKYAAPGDGVWVPVPLPEAPAEEPIFYKTLIHPDAKRPWAEVFAVAIDLKRARIQSVIGTAEPRGTAPGAKEVKRTGVIPAADTPILLAGFNGGFKEEHGHYGMKIDGVLVVRPRVDGCTIYMTQADELKISPWKTAKEEEPTYKWWRQTPACLIDDGKLHPALYDENTNWGAALGGGTVVRRSALGLDPSGKIAFVAVTNHTSPRAIAIAMQHLGAVNVAQLDINYSYPKFVLFPTGATGQREATSLFEGFKVEKDEYLRAPSVRDFFYIARRTEDRRSD